MKKIFLLLSVVALSSLTSCKKDSTCSCTTTSNAPTASGYSYTNTEEMTITKASKRTAKRACIKTESTDSFSGYTTTRDCKLK